MRAVRRRPRDQDLKSGLPRYSLLRGDNQSRCQQVGNGEGENAQERGRPGRESQAAPSQAAELTEAQVSVGIAFRFSLPSFVRIRQDAAW